MTALLASAMAPTLKDAKRIAESSDALNAVLATLVHLDLTDRITQRQAIMKAHGGYCDVFVGMACLDETHALRPKRRGLIKVAIKRLRVHVRSNRDFAKLLRKELTIWSKLRHANILPLLGFIKEGDYPSVISEWMENGTVKHYLEERPWTDREPLILGIAAGVRYLHMKNIVHSDLKADNVLVGNSGQPLICDFGISRIITQSLSFEGTSTTGLRGSARWMAPELFETDVDAHHTKATDVWAFGMTVYEILSQEVPFACLKNEAQVVFAVTRGKLPSCPLELTGSTAFLCFAWDICESCWISPAEKRVTIKEVVHRLRTRTLTNITTDKGVSGTLGKSYASPADPASEDDGSPREQPDVTSAVVLEGLIEQAHYWRSQVADEDYNDTDKREDSVLAATSFPINKLSSTSIVLREDSMKKHNDTGPPENVKKGHRRITLNNSVGSLRMLPAYPELVRQRVRADHQATPTLQSQFRSLLELDPGYLTRDLGQFALGDETDSYFNALARHNGHE